LERIVGSLKVSVLYLASAILGGLFSSLIVKANTVGASVAIYGLIGGYVLLLQ